MARASALQAGGHRFESYITHHEQRYKSVSNNVEMDFFVLILHIWYNFLVTSKKFILCLDLRCNYNQLHIALREMTFILKE